MKSSVDKIRPRRIFALKMRYRIYKKGVSLYFTGPRARIHFAGATLVVALFTSGGVGTYAYASDDVNVNHPLFPVKEGIESVEMGFAFSPEQKGELHLRKALRRLDEAEKLHKKFQGQFGMEPDAEAFQRTLEKMEEEMENCFNEAEGEYNVDDAEKVIAKYEEKMANIHQRLGGLPPVENGRPHISLMLKKIDETDEQTQNRIRKLEEFRKTMQSGDGGKMKRVMFQIHMEKGPMQFVGPPPLLAKPIPVDN